MANIPIDGVPSLVSSGDLRLGSKKRFNEYAWDVTHEPSYSGLLFAQPQTYVAANDSYLGLQQLRDVAQRVTFT